MTELKYKVGQTARVKSSGSLPTSGHGYAAGTIVKILVVNANGTYGVKKADQKGNQGGPWIWAYELEPLNRKERTEMVRAEFEETQKKADELAAELRILSEYETDEEWFTDEAKKVFQCKDVKPDAVLGLFRLYEQIK